MTTYKKAAPGTMNDPAAAAAEQDRRETLSGSTAYASGVAQAAQTFRDNCQREWDDCMASLKKTGLMRDATSPGRQAYDRSYQRLERVSARLADVLGRKVQIPEWHPPITREERMVSIGAAREDRTYRETKGMGPSGKGLPPKPVFGSAADRDWVQK